MTPDLFTQPIDLPAARIVRDIKIAQVSKNAGEDFGERARAFVLAFLREHGPSSGEAITDACKVHGIVPHDDRAFGGCFMSLSKRGMIVKAGLCQRVKGHATSGGNIWAIPCTDPKE